jgi:hypothetical protein
LPSRRAHTFAAISHDVLVFQRLPFAIRARRRRNLPVHSVQCTLASACTSCPDQVPATSSTARILAPRARGARADVLACGSRLPNTGDDAATFLANARDRNRATFAARRLMRLPRLRAIAISAQTFFFFARHRRPSYETSFSLLAARRDWRARRLRRTDGDEDGVDLRRAATAARARCCV